MWIKNLVFTCNTWSTHAIRNKSNLYLRAWALLFVFSIVAFHSFWPLNLDKFKIQININLFPIGRNENSQSDTVRRMKITRIELFKQKNKQRYAPCCYKAIEITLKKSNRPKRRRFFCNIDLFDENCCRYCISIMFLFFTFLRINKCHFEWTLQYCRWFRQWS